jgi:hypothetical protein
VRKIFIGCIVRTETYIFFIGDEVMKSFIRIIGLVLVVFYLGGCYEIPTKTDTTSGSYISSVY